MLLWLPWFLLSSLLIQSLFNSYLNLIKMLLWLPRLRPWSFLIHFLYKYDPKCSSGCLASSCCRFLFNSYSKLLQNVPLAALPPSSMNFLLHSYLQMMGNALLAPLFNFSLHSETKEMTNAMLSHRTEYSVKASPLPQETSLIYIYIYIYSAAGAFFPTKY